MIINNNNRYYENCSNSELSEYFKKINSKLEQLNSYADENFSSLTSKLRDYYRNARGLYSDTQGLLKYNDDNDQVIVAITEMFEKVVSQKQFISENISGVSINLKELHSSVVVAIEKTERFSSKVSELHYRIKKSSTHSSSKTDSLFVVLKSISAVFENKLFHVKCLLKNNKTMLNNLLRSRSVNSNSSNTEMQEAWELFISNHLASNEVLKSLEVVNKDNYEELDKLVVFIQFHDMVRQKLEHIVNINEKIIDELSSNISEENIDTEEKCIAIIPEITDINIAQLDYSNDECQSAFRNIVAVLNQFDENIISVENLSIQLSKKNVGKLSYIDIVEVRRMQKKSEELIERTKVNNDRIEEYIINVNNDIESVFLFMEKLGNLSEQIDKCIGQIKDVDGFEIQIDLLIEMVDDFGVANVNSRDISFSDLLRKLQSNTESIDEIISHNLTVKTFAKKYKRLAGFLTNAIDSDSQKHTDLENVISRNSTTSRDLRNDIHPIIEHLNDSGYFNTLAKDIVNDYKNLQNILVAGGGGICVDDKEKTLNRISKLYTMQSERNVQESVSTQNGDAKSGGVSLDEILDDDNIELF